MILLKQCKTFLFVTLMLFTVFAKSQHSELGILFSNNITSFPITTYPQIFYTQFHLGLDVFKSWKLNQNEKNQIWFSGNLGGYYHRFIQTTIRLYPAIDYERLLGNRFSVKIAIGAGYSLAFENMETFELQDDGTYKTKFLVARSQYLVNIGFGCNYSFKKGYQQGMKISFQFKTFIQGPFVTGYVPILPVNAAMLGITIPLNKAVENEI